MGTAIVLLVLCAIVGAVIYKMVKDKRSGKSSCGGNCAGCGMACHQSKEMKQYGKRLPLGGLFACGMDCMVYNLKNLGYNTVA